MTIGNEIVSLTETTENIKTQVKNKGQSVSATTKLSELPNKIDNIVNTGGEKIVYTVDEIITGDIQEIFDKTCTYLRPNCFRNCTKLEKATFYTITKICSYAFCSCYRFHTLILPGEFVYLDDINAFRYTRIENIYVKDSLVNTYKNDPRWSYFKSKIKAFSSL